MKKPITSAEILPAPIYPGDAAEGIGVAGADRNVKREAAKHGWRVLATLSTLMGFASISTDLYLPAMPDIGHALGTNTGMMEWTVSGYLIGFSLGQLLWGPIGDRHGRRLPVATGLIFFIIGSAGCAMALTPWAMIFWRLVQAIGASAGVVLGRAMVRGLYEGERAAQMMSTLLTVMAIAPLVGPLLGGQILALAGWRTIFWTLVGIGAATLVALAVLPETLSHERRNHAPLGRAMIGYIELICDRRLLAYAGAGGFYFAGMFAYVAGTPFVYITYYHVPPQYYGLLFALGIVGIMATNFANSKLVSRVGGTILLFRGAVIAALGGILSAIAAMTGWSGLLGLMLPLLIYVGVTGFIVANSIAGALANFPKRAGAVAALIGAFQYGSGMIGSALIGVFADGTPLPMAIMISVGGIGCFVCARSLTRNL